MSSSPGVLGPAFDTLLENATHLCGATHGNLWLSEGDAFRSVAVLGELPHTYLGRWGVGAVINPEPDIPIAIATRTRQPFQYPDIRESPPTSVAIRYSVCGHRCWHSLGAGSANA